jgi:hypothetical protein
VRELPALLHNMSVQPRTTIEYRAGPGSLRGWRLVFALPDDLVDTSPAALLERLDGLPFSGDADAELRRRLDDHADRLDLPGAAAVLDRAGADDPVCDDLLTVLCVLSRSSNHVYLRTKEPCLTALRPGRRVVLLLPPQWRRP